MTTEETETTGTERTVEMTLDNLVRMALIETMLMQYVEEPWRFRYLTAKVAARAITDDTFMEFLHDGAHDPKPDDMPESDEVEVEPDDPEPGHEEGR